MQRSIIAPAERVTNLRWGIAVLLACGLFLVAMTHNEISAWLLVPPPGAPFGTMNPGVASLPFDALLAFALGLVPFGMLTDRFGAMHVGRGAAVALFAGALALATSGAFGVIMAAEIVLGLAWSAAAVAALAAIASWFPIEERAGAAAIVAAGALAGVATAEGNFMLALGSKNGMHNAEVAVAVLSGLFAVLFALFYRDAAGDSRLTYAERTYIERGGAQAGGAPAGGALRSAFTKRAFWGTLLAFAGTACMDGFVLLTDSRANDGLPWIVAAVATVIFAGALTDALVKRSGDGTVPRRIVFCASLLIGLAAFCAGLMSVANLAVFGWCEAIAIASFSVATSTMISIPGLIAPRGAAGSIGGIAGLLGLVGFFASAPLLRGRAVESVESYLVVVTIVILVAIFAFVFLLGRVEPIGEPERGVLI